MQHIAKEVYGFTVIYGDTDSIFVTGIKKENDINKFLAECSIVLEDIEIELSKVYSRMIIIKKKHYIGINQDSSKDSDIKGIEGIKSDRPPWINQLQHEFVDDLKFGRDPTVKLKKAYEDMEKGIVATELLEIKTTLRKDPESYPPTKYQRIVGSQLNAKEGDIIKYYKSDIKGKAHSDPIFLSRAKYIQMLKSTFEDQLKVLGYDFMQDVVGVRSLQIYDEERAAKVKQGVKFILSHFEGRQQLFPRTMSTALSQGRQFIVYTEDQILHECEKAGFVDCRLNAYSVLEQLQSNELNIFSAQAPNVLFIDIDLSKGFESQEEAIIKLNKILKKTLNIIQRKLDGCKPTVLWTGNGYHIYIVLNTRPLELISELSEKPSEEFLRFAEFIFTNKRKDSCHNTSFKSSLLRIPHTLNSKCIELITGNYIKDPEVKIIQEFDSLAIPTINNKLLREFWLYLADKDIIITTKRESIKRRSNQINICRSHSLANVNRRTTSATYQWIEKKLLQTPIADHRKHTIDLVLAPFLIVIKRLSFEESYSTIKHWIVKCNSIEMLRPSIEYFDNRIKTAINNSIQCKIPPILQENMEKKYPDWHSQLKGQNIISDIDC
jgi:hypothetical protein